jgi:beta-lactamase class A
MNGSVAVARMARALRRLLIVVAVLPAAVFAQDNPESVRAKQDALWNRMEDSVRKEVRRTDAVMGVAIIDLTDKRSFYLNADAVYPTASTIKIAVLAELYNQDERGSGARLSDLYTVDAKDLVGTEGALQVMTPAVTRLTNRDLAALVVTVSDNSATNVLIDRVGMDNVNAWLERVGLKQTRLRRHMLDVKAAQEGRENTATPRELGTLLTALYEGRALKKATSDELIKMLSTPKSSYIPTLLPAELAIANKSGFLDGVRNDAGIVFVPGRPFAIVVMTTFAANEVEAERGIARIARAAWSYFDRIGKSSPLGRILQ